MRSLRSVFVLGGSVILAAAWCGAQEAGPEAPGSGVGGKPPGEGMFGYWAIDTEDKAMLGMIDDLAGMLASLAPGDGAAPAEAKAAARREVVEVLRVSALEFRQGEVSVYGPEGMQKSAYTIKSQDAGTGTFELEMTKWNDTGKQPGRAVLKDGRFELTTGEGEEMESMVLKRIDAAEFKKRKVAAAKMNEEAREDGNGEESPDGGAGAGAGPGAVGDGGYPVAVPVPDRPGFVFSPHNNEVVDVSGIPSGTLVRDPRFPVGEKKFFRLP